MQMNLLLRAQSFLCEQWLVTFTQRLWEAKGRESAGNGQEWRTVEGVCVWWKLVEAVCVCGDGWGGSGRKINRENEGEEEAGSFLKLTQQSINQQPPEPPGEWRACSDTDEWRERSQRFWRFFPWMYSYFKDSLVMLVAWLQGWQCPQWNISTTTGWIAKNVCIDVCGGWILLTLDDFVDDICSSEWNIFTI